MADIPMLFSAPMVLALLLGTKTQTRRAIKGVPEAPSDDNLVHEPKHPHVYFDSYCGGKKTKANPRGMTPAWCWWTRDDRCGAGCKVPYVPGDRIWVRERFIGPRTYEHLKPKDWPKDRPCVLYPADEHRSDPPHPVDQGVMHPAIHMPRFMSRLTLLVTNVRVQKLQDIDETDSRREGIQRLGGDALRWQKFPDYQNPDKDWLISARESYASLWDSLNGQREGLAWKDNPWVAAIDFSVHTCNIDEVPT